MEKITEMPKRQFLGGKIGLIVQTRTQIENALNHSLPNAIKTDER